MKNNDFDVATGIVLKEARIDCGLKQFEVAKIVVKSRNWLSDIEHGKNAIFWNDLKELCNIYGITPSYVAEKVDKILKGD